MMIREVIGGTASLAALRTMLSKVETAVRAQPRHTVIDHYKDPLTMAPKSISRIIIGSMGMKTAPTPRSANKTRDGDGYDERSTPVSKDDYQNEDDQCGDLNQALLACVNGCMDDL